MELKFKVSELIIIFVRFNVLILHLALEDLEEIFEINIILGL